MVTCEIKHWNNVRIISKLFYFTCNHGFQFSQMCVFSLLRYCALFVLATVKRGRGRPRRKPLPPEELSSVMVLDGGSPLPLSVLHVSNHCLVCLLVRILLFLKLKTWTDNLMCDYRKKLLALFASWMQFVYWCKKSASVDFWLLTTSYQDL